QARLEHGKTHTAKRTLNALLDWARNEEPGPELKLPTPYEVEYLPPILADRFYDPRMKVFNSLVLAMLRTDPKQRLTIGQVLDHNYFSGMNITPCIMQSKIVPGISHADRIMVTIQIRTYVPDDT